MNEPLTDDNFVLYCAKNYDGRYCSSTDDFYADLSRIKYIKRLITQYKSDSDLKTRLILNHIMILYNIFGPKVLCEILYLKMKEDFIYIKPFLVLINSLPEKLYNINDEKVIDTNLINMDKKIVEELRKIKNE
jgi:hypothetical protein